MTVGDRLEKWAWWVDRRPALMILVLTAVYVVLIHHFAYRHLWFDELHTFYIAQAPSLSRFFEEIRLLDLNPPLQYALVRGSFELFGRSELTTRLPVILIFFIGSMCTFVFMRRRVGALWAAAGVQLSWYTLFFYLATEARPYGILIGCLGITLMSWDFAISGIRRGWALAGISIGALGMILSHVYAPLWIMPFWASEIVRDWRQRRIDWPVWATLVLPLVACVTYLPLVRSVGSGVFPPQFLGSVEAAAFLYLRILLPDFLPVLIAAAAAFAIAAWRGTKPIADLGAPQLTFFTASLLPPALLNALSIYKHIPFYDRYASPAALTISIAILLFVAHESKANRLSGLVTALVFFGFSVLFPVELLHSPFADASQVPQISVSRTPFGRIHPELPMVINNALVFLEIDHYEDDPNVLERLYYLADPEFALEYTKTNVTEGLPVLKRYFPIRANILPYSVFILSHRHFLVWGRIDDELGWLLRKLRADQVAVRELGDFESADYSGKLYEVNLDP
jgi:Dolichyl-phosphate-mannose-protein mannosyltransferase